MTDQQHADYPHEPGYLYDCAACESRCHCTPGHAQCVFDGEHTPNDFACPPMDSEADRAYVAACGAANAEYLAAEVEASKLRGGNKVRAEALDRARTVRDAAYGVAWRTYVKTEG